MAAKNKPNELYLTRIYDAPVKTVWEAFTDSKQVEQWWGPRGFTLTTHSKDLKPGGHWAYTMHGPDGKNWENKTIYHEVEKYSRLVYDHGGNDDRPPLFRVTAVGLAILVYLSGHWQMNHGAVGRAYFEIAANKAALPFWQAFFLGVLCNILVCMAVWMAHAGRSVTDKFIAILAPVSAFVAAGFEHSVANLYFFAMALLFEWFGPTQGQPEIGLAAMLGNLVPVIAGNIVGGGVLVALVYWVIYLRGSAARDGG